MCQTLAENYFIKLFNPNIGNFFMFQQVKKHNSHFSQKNVLNIETHVTVDVLLWKTGIPENDPPYWVHTIQYLWQMIKKTFSFFK